MTRWIPMLTLLLMGGCSEPSGDDGGGFAGLATEVDAVDEADFAQPAAGDRLSFPADFGAHPKHRIEWWYLTANLETSDGEPLGLQWTQFRQSLKPRSPSEASPVAAKWPLEAVWMAHAAVSFKQQHVFEERLARADVGHAGVVAEPFEVWLDDWLLRAVSGDTWRLSVDGDHWAYDLQLHLKREPVAHGRDGFSAKSRDGQGSMYFSLVDLAIEGTVTLQGKTHTVEGTGWFDREWSSQLLKAGQKGWDWFAVHLDDGHKLMAFRLREAEEDFLSGSWIAPDGTVTALEPGDLDIAVAARRAVNAGQVPDQFRVTIPARGVDLLIEAPEGIYWNDGLFPYWESPVSVSGSHSGVGYMELTGYRD